MNTLITRGMGMTGRIVAVLLLSLLAIGTQTETPTIERTDLPLRVRVVRRIGDVMQIVLRQIGEEEPAASRPLMQGPIDETWVDAQLPSDGFIPPTQTEIDEMYGDEFPQALVIPRGDWQQWITSNQAAGFSLLMYNDTLNFQAPEHSCVSNATETAIRVVRNRQLGLTHSVKCSPMSLYCRVNSHRWGGSSMLGNLEESSARGILPEDTPDQRLVFGDHVAHQNTLYFPQSQLPAGWQETAKHFRPLKFFRIRNSEQFASALLRGFPIVNGRSGHSICHLELVYKDGRFLSKYADSYGVNRGDGGYLYDTEAKWNTGGAWCLRSVTCPDDVKFPAGKKTSMWRPMDERDAKCIDVQLIERDVFDAGRYRRRSFSDTVAA